MLHGVGLYLSISHLQHRAPDDSQVDIGLAMWWVTAASRMGRHGYRFALVGLSPRAGGYTCRASHVGSLPFLSPWPFLSPEVAQISVPACTRPGPSGPLRPQSPKGSSNT